ncbi:Crp/Fnr family transcriptional regulator [Puia dinghuensis]|uniref:Cyclic nucleotide-binding protein n=1 Tax=Puia dinghuensis TaxID=1792502 RepID=A0A8J2XVX3_9BACT|nr:Crp/Fnr family transcriptional regulator [Puia dinghuensis]GGB19201.1 cyclic nucleotide-binding protein [Puia dinghuensis]
MIDYDAILKNVGRHVAPDAEETEHFISLLKFQRLPRKALLLREGQACKHFYFVHSGTLRAYCMDARGRESTIMFAPADWWVTDMYCFLNGRRAMMYIEALVESEVFRIGKPQLDELLGRWPTFERWFRILMQNAYTREQLRAIDNLSLSAEERYVRFVEKYPLIAGQVTQKQIASYLGITPEFLSAILKKQGKRRGA